jgi:glutamine amidotransferase/cyclase
LTGNLKTNRPINWHITTWQVSIGSDAVKAAEAWLATGTKTGETAIEKISYAYGRQAVVISLDPRIVWVSSAEDPAAAKHAVVEAHAPGPNGEKFCWFQVTVRGGREGRDMDAPTLAKACEDLGAGEIMVNCINMDGQNAGYCIPLLKLVCAAVSIPVIASSGAGAPEHFAEAFDKTTVQAALAAGIFHRREVPISAVKAHLLEQGVPSRKGGS